MEKKILNCRAISRNPTIAKGEAVFSNKIRLRFLGIWLKVSGKRFWRTRSLVDIADLHKRLKLALSSAHPTSVGRLGGVEAALVMWAEAEGKFPSGALYSFSDTCQGATHAGIRPRNKESYRLFASLCREALDGLDVQGVWKTGYEAVCLRGTQPRVLHDGEISGPDGKNPDHWLCSLRGKRVLVVSPFPRGIAGQIPRLGKVWPQMQWMHGTEFMVEPFPYLIEEDCPETWWEVYDRIGKVVSRGEYDVALFGCGGLGLPFAHLAKKAGRIGMHLGGHLQLIFGIYGQRHLHHHWFRDQMNEFWIRPDASEVPKSAKRVEGGCYW